MPNLSVLANWADIIAVVIALISILGLVWQDRRFRERRAIACTFFPATSPINIGSAGRPLEAQIEIRYKGHSIDNLFVMQAKLENTGNAPIRKSQVVEPITFTFDSRTELVDKPRVVYTKPSDFEVSWEIREANQASKLNEASLDFELLNQQDELLVEFVWIGQPTEPQVTARIEGIREIEMRDTDSAAYKRLEWASRLFLFSLILALGWLIVTILLNPSDLIIGLFAGFILAGVVGYISNRIRFELMVRRSQMIRKKIAQERADGTRSHLEDS